MSDKLDLKLNVDVAVSQEEQLVALRKEMGQLAHEIGAVAAGLKGLMANTGNLSNVTAGIRKSKADALAGDRDALQALKGRFAFEKRMRGQKAKEEAQDNRAARQQIAEDERRFKALFDFNSRMAVARERAAKSAATAALKADKAEAKARGASIREAARQAERAAQARVRAEAEAERQVRAERRETAAQITRQRKEHERAMERAQRGAGQVRQGVGQVAGYGGAAAGALGYGAARVIGRGVSTRMEIDSAETAIKMFNDTDDGKGGRRAITDADIKQLRRGPRGLDSEAIKNGVSISEALRVYNEASKAGLQDPMAQTRTILSAGSALELNPQAITSLFGVMGRNMGANATAARSKSVANAIAVAAREDPTQANEIVEGMRRAQSVLAMSKGITEEDLAGMVSGGISAGIQPGKAGTHISSLAKSISEGNNRFLDPKKRKELNFAARNLGFGSAKGMATQFSGENGKAVIYQVLDKLKSMTPDMRSRVAEALSGGQWSDETLQVVNGLDGMKHTDAEIHDPKNANFLDDSRNKRMQSWKGIWDQSQAIFSLFWESFGSGFDNTLREINSFFLDLNGKFNYDSVNEIVRDSLDGLRKGLGFSSWKEALASIVPTDVRSMGPAIRDFATGFGSGIRSVADVIKGVASFFGGGDGAENMGRLAGKFLLLSSAALALTPVLGVITGISGVVLGMVGMARAAGTFLGARAVGGGAMAGIARGAASLAGWPAVGIAIGSALIDYLTPRLSDWLRARLGPGFASDAVTSGQRAITGGDNFVGSASTWILDLFRDRPGHAVGGYVSGPGGPTSDSVMARLSNGEFVVNASAAARHGSLLNAINSGRTPGLALGGSVGIGSGSSSYVSPFAAMRASDDMKRLTDAIVDLVRIIRFENGNRLTRSRGGAGGIGGGGGVPGVADGPPEARPGSVMGQVVGRGRHGLLGGGAINPQLSGDVAARAKEAHDYFRSQGYSEEATAGILASLKKESNFTAGARGDGGRAHGIAQWHADRRRQILQGTGIDVSSASYSDQLRAVAWEMRHGDAGAQRAHRALMTPGITAREAGGAFVQHFERPARDERVERGALAEGFHQQFGRGGGAGSGPLAGLGGSSRALDAARGLVGAGSGQAAAALGSRMTPGNWCADFVNGALRSANIRGVNSSIANSFLGWGQQVMDGVKAGDVVVTHRGRGVGQTGGHVGLATGETRMRNGRLQYKTVSGNHGNRVGEGWEYADSVAVRRAQEANEATRAAAGAAENRNGAVSLREGAVGQRQPLGQSTPLGTNAPLRNGSAGGGSGISGSGHTFHNTVTIQGHNQSPNELANAVQRSLADGMNRRTHDYDGFA